MPSILHQNLNVNPKKLALELAEKATLFRSVVHRELNKERSQYRHLCPKESDWDPQQGDWARFPLIQRYLTFHTQLIPLEKSNRDEDRSDGFLAFADMYAQTATYGLLAARWMLKDKSTAFTSAKIRSLLPSTSTFLKSMLMQLLEIQSSVCVDSCIQDMIFTLSNIDVHAVFQATLHDPVIHFYEDFLHAYDQEQRQDQGVYYTPPEIVDFIVCEIDTKLKTKFGLPLGLASTKTWNEVLAYVNHDTAIEKRALLPKTAHGTDMFVRILDPATGTGTFVTRIIEQIRDNLKNHWANMGWSTAAMKREWSAYLCGKKGMERDYTGQGLLHRLYAFELMMAPYIITHLRVGLLLQADREVSFELGEEDRLHVLLTNALERAEDRQLSKKVIHRDDIRQESRLADTIKEHTAIPIIVGNPPYNARANRPYLWFDGQRKPPQKGVIEEYKYVDGIFFDETKHWLSDEYVKFIKMGEQYIKRSGIGVLGFINPHGMYDNPTFRGMRWFLLNFYSNIDIVDLHGNVRRKEVDEHGAVCENVFSIQTGVGINIFTRTPQQTQYANVQYAELRGKKEDKLVRLKTESLQRMSLDMSCYSHSFDHYFFVPKDFTHLQSYSDGICVIDLFRNPHTHSRNQPFSSGIITANDALLIQISKKQLSHDIKRVLSKTYTKEDMRREFKPGNTYLKWFFSPGAYTPSKHEQATFDPQRIARLIYRPFDFRYTYYDPLLIHQSRAAVMKPLLQENLAIIVSRTVQGDNGWHDVQITDSITEFGIMASRVGNAAPICPIFHYRNGVRESNFHVSVAVSLVGHYGVPLDLLSAEYGRHDVITGVDITYYILATLSSPQYRAKYQDLLKSGFPFVPKHHSLAVFRALIQKGKELRDIQLLEADIFAGLSSRLSNSDHSIAQTCSILTQVRPKAATKAKSKRIKHWNGQIWINDHQYFNGISERVWNSYIGGYRPAYKWLKDRKGKALTKEEIVHYTKIITALEETHRVMKEIDAVHLF